MWDELKYRNNVRLRNSFRVVLACAAFLLIGGLVRAQSQVQGLITGRSGATMTVKTQDNDTIVVALTADTQVQEVQSANDISWFEYLSKFVNDEPIRERDKVMIGMLSSLGIEKGKPMPRPLKR
jgi:hypothetical protein